MPVLGHAFVGLATGVVAAPSTRGQSPPPADRATSALWLPALVVLAYLPDVVAQVGAIAGWNDARLLGHSVLFAVVASPAIAALLVRLGSVSFTRALLTAVISLVLHDALDMAQATDRAPWWPLSARPLALDLPLIPTGLLAEATLFGGLLLVFLGVRHAAQRWADGEGVSPSRHEDSRGPWVWLGRTLVVSIALAAGATHVLRDARERDFEMGRILVEQRAYRAGLEALARAEHWPSTAKPGRIDHLRAEAHIGLGNRSIAEAHYLRAYQGDPGYFWAVADLALFYASSGDALDERRRKVRPYVTRLRSEFAHHRDLPGVLARLERKLAAPWLDGALELPHPPAESPSTRAFKGN